MMPSVLQLVVTDNFAGVERYVATTARELAARGCDVVVVGGHSEQMPSAAGAAVQWLPGSTVGRALHSMARIGRRDVCHAHMTTAEATALLGRPLHRAPVVSTRHFAAHRGSTLVGRSLRPFVSAGLAREIAASDFIARQMERCPDAVLRNGVARAAKLWQPTSRTVIVLQRLEPEKETLTALQAWRLAGLWEEGWTMRVVGDGSQREMLELWVADHNVPAVSFAGWVEDVERELAAAGMMLAVAPAEGLGLGVLEAMGVGVPVVAAAAGGHLESAARLPDAPTFHPGDAEDAAAAIRALVDVGERSRLSQSGMALVDNEFSVSSHVDRLLDEYATVTTTARPRPLSRRLDLIVCSLESWDTTWRRNQFLVDRLLKRNREMRILFVEPPVDVVHDLAAFRVPVLPRIRTVGYDGRLHALRPLKPLPRKLGGAADALLGLQVRAVAGALRFSEPTLWLNDLTYAPLIRSAGWATVYDITDDWLAAPFASRELRRLERLERVALQDAAAVTVCSPGLARSRGGMRPVTLIPNAVDAEHLRRPQRRPHDLPPGPVLMYVGTLHEARLDVGLVVDVARSIPEANLVLVGPNALSAAAERVLRNEPNIWLAGSRSYQDIPGYLQHADVLIVPHVENDFTESLDPIKAYECVAVGVPTVATPVAGFRGLGGAVRVAPRDAFVERVEEALATRGEHEPHPVPAWHERAVQFEKVLNSIGLR